MKTNVRRLTLAAAAGLAIAGSNAVVSAEEMEEIVVKGDLGSLPGERVESVFGFEKSILGWNRNIFLIATWLLCVIRFNFNKEASIGPA